jgi:very-short-patch-repair endonuclease
VVRSTHGTFIARVDLSWPDREIFFELDGQGHKDQPVYDATRETAVVAATGWLPGRFTWSEIVRIPVSTQRRFAQLGAQSDRRRAA